MNHILKEGILFILIGSIFTATNFVFYSIAVFLLGIDPTIAAAVAFLLLIPPHFYSYSRIVFRQGRENAYIAGRYLAALAISVAINVLLVGFYTETLLAQPIVAQILSLGPAIAANYILFKYFVFSAAGLGRLPVGSTVHMLIAAILCVAIYLAVATILLHINQVF